MDEKWKSLIDLGIHWRSACRTTMGLGRTKMHQYGYYYLKLTVGGMKLRFHVEIEHPSHGCNGDELEKNHGT